MKPETKSCNMHCHPILNYTKCFKAPAHRKIGVKSSAKFVQYRNNKSNEKLLMKAI